MWAERALELRTIGAGVLLGCLLAGCASSDAVEERKAQAAATQESVDQILAAPLGAEAYAKTERCLSTAQYDSVEILDDRHVLFKGIGKRVWLNELRSRCIGLDPRSTPVIRLRDSQLCDMDTFQGVDSTMGIWTRSSATCSLGKFTAITPEQAEALRAAFKEARQRR
ncbi:MAG: DUF6491 family protein [Pseudomonadales bacterium]|jgi:outer membrane murein-binding lipoprotein Lpp